MSEAFYSCGYGDCAVEETWPEEYLRLDKSGVAVCQDCWECDGGEYAREWGDWEDKPWDDLEPFVSAETRLRLALGVVLVQAAEGLQNDIFTTAKQALERDPERVA